MHYKYWSWAKQMLPKSVQIWVSIQYKEAILPV